MFGQWECNYTHVVALAMYLLEMLVYVAPLR